MDQLIGAAPQVPADVIKDSDTPNFKADVIDASMQVPVIVDFWAPWCGPCKQLGPVIEKAVKEAKGAVRLVKINVDENQELAAQMRIQSIPAVYAFFQGRPVDGFVGAQPESQLKQFVARLAKIGGEALGPSPIDEALEQAEQVLAGGDHGAASAIFSEVLEHEPENAKAVAGLARCLIAMNELAAAREFLDNQPADVLKDAGVTAAKTQLDLAEQGQKSAGKVPELRARIAANPKDFEARYELAEALFGGSEREEAIDQLLTIMRVNRAWNEEAARLQLVKFFEAMGPTDPLTLSGRRQLSSILFA
ncbi:MAG TPA: thioredoxin [Dongiaceae bacterium]|nr:thioredoxin [Dongiaceae bacterium]